MTTPKRELNTNGETKMHAINTGRQTQEPVHRIDVWWDTDSGRDSEGWAIHVYGEDKSELYSGGISAADYEDLDSVIEQGLWEAGIEGLTHDDFAKSKVKGGSAHWVAN